MIDVDGRELKVLVLRNPLDMMQGLRPYQDVPGDFDGLLFVFPNVRKREFTGSGMSRSVYLCLLRGTRESFSSVKCTCLPPGGYTVMDGRIFIERLASDGCEQFYTFGGVQK